MFPVYFWKEGLPMTMMISKFHRLIQSRLLWGAFLIIIVFSFVIWGMVWPSDVNKMEQANAAGMLDGELISHSEYRSAYLSSFMARSLTSGRDWPPCAKPPRWARSPPIRN